MAKKAKAKQTPPSKEQRAERHAKSRESQLDSWRKWLPVFLEPAIQNAALLQSRIKKSHFSKAKKKRLLLYLKKWREI